MKRVSEWLVMGVCASVLACGGPPSGSDLVAIDDGEAPTEDELLELVTVASPLDTLEIDVPDLPDSSVAETRESIEQEEKVEYGVPIDLDNVRVLTFIDTHSVKQRDWFGRSLARSGRYMPMIERIFTEEGIPTDLAYMALIESGYRHNARSRVGAIGMWQFMRGTARRYGLVCNAFVDERLDPERATRAAARYLSDLHDMFGDWYLAMAAYNAGEGKVQRAIRRAGTRDFWRLAETRYLVQETRNFVPAILAAMVVGKSRDEFGFDPDVDDPIVYDTVEVESVTHVDVMAQCVDVPSTIIRALNPALISLQTPPGHHPYEVRIPVGASTAFLDRLAAIPPDDRMLYVRHKVNQGETLSMLARNYGTSVGSIQQANSMGRSTVIRVGRTLLIPTTAGYDDQSLAALLGQGEKIYHRVRRGQTLSHIAGMYGTTPKAIQAWNQLSSPDKVREGQRLVLFSGVERATPRGTTFAAAGRSGGSGGSGDNVGMTVHRVRKGDTMWSIARQYGVSVTSLRKLNPSVGSIIRPGQPILVGGKTGAGQAFTHRVAHGETLWEIASQYGITVTQIRTWNGMTTRESLIRPGDDLTLYR